MKPNEKQKKICSLVSMHANYWNHTNDINSQTHEGDLGEDLKAFNDFDNYSAADLTPDQKVRLDDLMLDLLNFIRTVE